MMENEKKETAEEKAEREMLERTRKEMQDFINDPVVGCIPFEELQRLFSRDTGC